MAMYEFLPDAFEIPVDVIHPLEPTRALAIHLPAPLITHHPSQIQDLTSRLPSLFSRNLGITDENLLSAHKASTLSPPPPIRYVLEKQNLLGTHLAILDAEGNEIADWKHPLLTLGFGSGKTEIKFPGENKNLEIKKVDESRGKEKSGSSHGLPYGHRHAERFVNEGTIYFWETEPVSSHQLALLKVFGDERDGILKREVARYAQRSVHEREGLLVVDTREVDEIVVVLTLCAMFESKDSFLK